MIIITVGIVTRRVRMDMTIIIRIFNRMLMMVIILNRIIINLKWMVRILINIEGMVIRMRLIIATTISKYGHSESKDYYCRYNFGLRIALMSKVSPTWDALRSCSVRNNVKEYPF